MYHHIILTNQFLKDINPIVCGLERCKKSHYFGPASREYYLLHYIVSGKGIFRRQDKTYILSKGDIFIIRPDEITFYQADAEDPLTYIWVGFECNFPRNLATQVSFLQKDILHLQSCEYVFKSMLECDKMKAKELHLCGKIYKLFSLISELETKYNNDPYGPEEYVSKAKHYIATNYTNHRIRVGGNIQIPGHR